MVSPSFSPVASIISSIPKHLPCVSPAFPRPYHKSWLPGVFRFHRFLGCVDTDWDRNKENGNSRNCTTFYIMGVISRCPRTPHQAHFLSTMRWSANGAQHTLPRGLRVCPRSRRGLWQSLLKDQKRAFKFQHWEVYNNI